MAYKANDDEQLKRLAEAVNKLPTANATTKLSRPKPVSTTPIMPSFTPTHRDLPSIQTDLTAAKRERSGLLNDFGFNAPDLSDFRVQLDNANANVNRYKAEKLIEDKVYQSEAKEDTFAGQFSANKTLGRLTQNQSKAWNEYLKNPTPENRKTAESYDKAIEDYTKKNKIALDDQNVKLGIISQSYANYLPQQIDQLKAQVPGALAGGAVGLLAGGNVVAGAKIGASISSGADMFDLTRGAAFKRLIDLGVDEETARALATDEGIVQGIIEGGDTYLDWTLFGGKALATKLLPSLSAKASTAAGKSAIAKAIKAISSKVDDLPTAAKVLGAYGLNVPQEGLEEGSQELVSIANDQRALSGSKGGLLDLAKGSFDVGKTLLTGGDIVTGYDENGNPIKASQQVKDAAKEGMRIAAVSGGMQAIGGYAAQRALTPKQKSTDTQPTVSPAASPAVQQVRAQAEITQAQNPESDVLDAATTLFTQQGMNLKTAQKRAEIVGKLVRGEEVSDKDLNRIDPTSKQTKAIFTQLTGVQFPAEATSIEKLRDLYRSAHTVAQAAEAQQRAAEVQAIQQMSAEQIVERAKQARQATTPETDAQAARILAQARGEIAPDNTPLLSYKDFSARHKQVFPDASPQETARMYDLYLKDNQTISFMGRRMTRQQVHNTLRSAPDGDKLTVAELDAMFDMELEAQSRDGKDATEHSVRNKEANNGKRESGQSPVQHDGQSGQSGERTGVAAAGLDQGTGSQEGTGSQADRENSGGLREGSRGPVNPDAVSADGETNFMEIHEESWSDEMRAQTPKFKRAGITLRSALGPIPIPGTTRSCDGVSHLGVESIVQSDSPFFSFEQLCDHEVGHQYFFRDPALYQKCFLAYKQHTSKAQRNALLTVYLGSYADVYAQKSASDQAKIRNQIVEEIICDAYAGMNRSGANADQLQEFIKPIVDDWCAARDAELESAEKRYSIDSMAEAVGLTFEKDGQMTVFKDGNGNRVDEVTEKMVQTSPLGAVIQSAVDKKFITDADAGKQITFFTELYNLMLKTQDIDLLWAVSSSIGFQPLESGPRDSASLNQKSKFAGYTKNSDPQYSTTVDFTTICLKTQAVIDAMSATMMELGHGLTEDEIVNIVYRNTHEAGEPVPCPVCYVFSRWVGLGGLFDNMNNLQTQYANADLEVLRADIETLSQRIDEIMVERGYALATGKGGSKSYALPNSSTKKSFGDAKIVMEKELMSRQLELQAKQNQDMVSGKKTMTKAEEAELAALKRDIQILDNWTWLTDVRLSENYTPVPPEILFDINAGKEFAERYPESWKFRTTRGPAMGKAATPYADEHLGQILRGAGTSDLKKAELGDPAKNPFLKSKNGKLTPAAEKALQKSIAKIKAQNLLNGQRYQSTSDFRFEYALDYLLSFVEMQALGGKVQLYTKVAEAVRMFASIGAEVNCSLMPLGIGYRVNKDGSKTLTFSSVTGMNAEDAFNLSNEFDNVQPIMVGIGNEHIRLCMADDRITFIIPYHASGAGEARYVALMDIVGEHVEEREDYSNYQTDHKIEKPTTAQKSAYDLRLKLLTGKLGILSDADKQVLQDNEILHNLYKRFYGKDMDGNISDIDPKYLNPEARNSGKLFRDNECYGAFLTSEQAKNVMPFEYWDRTSTIDQADLNGQAFVEYCESLGLRPRFSGWDSNGVYHAEFDFSKESGYWKMLIDRSVYNRDGSYHEQQAINVTNFDAGFLLREESVKGIVQPSLVNDPAKTEKIAQKSADQVREKRGEKKYSVSDSEYVDIASDGQLLTKDQVEYFKNSKARDHMDRLMTMFHGTKSFGFTVFDPEFSDDGISLFFTDRPSTSRTYTGTKENDIRALSKDTDMSKYEHDGKFSDNDEAWKYLEQSGYKRVGDALTPDQVRDAFESVVEIDVEEAKTWLEALETELPKILNERRWTVAQNNSIRRLKDAIAEVEDLRSKPDYDSDLYFDVVHGAMTELFEAELAIMDNLEWYREDVRTVEGWDVLEGLSAAISEPGYAKRHWDRLNDAYFEAVHYESPVHVVLSPTEGAFHLSDEALHSEARRVWRDNQRGLYEVYLNLENPLIVDANENNWNDLDYADLSDVEDNVYYYWEGDDTRSIAEWAKENGYDGVIFRNVYDHGRYRTGDEPASTVMIAFKSEQVKSTANEHPTSDPDIRYSISDTKLSFADQVDLVHQNKLNEFLVPGTSGRNPSLLTNSAVYVTKEPNSFMQELGYGDLAIVVTQDHIRQMLGKREDASGNVVDEHNHQLSPRQVKSLPKLLEKPAAVLRAKGRPESLIFVTTEKDYRGRPIIVPVKANGVEVVYNGISGPAHVVTSMYGRDNFDAFFENAVKQGQLVYYNKKRIDPILTAPGYQSSGLLSGIDSDTILGEVNPVVKDPGQRKYSITPQFEQWYKETYGTDLTSAQLKRRLQTAERRAAEAEHDKKAAELKNTIDSEMDLTAWMIHHTKKMREQKRVSDAKLAEARKAKTEAVRTAVAETKEIERAKAEVQHDADRMAERRNAAKRLRTQENAYTNKVTEMKENAKLKRNAAKATLRDSRLAAKKRAAIETEQGLVDTIRKNPKQRTGVEKLQDAAQQLRTLGRSAYRNFVNMAESIDRFSKRQVSDMRAGTLVNILGGSASTMEAVFKKGLVDRAGNRIGESMSDVFLCWDDAHKKVNEGQQALLQDFMLHWHNIDRMSIVARAESALETFELNNEWLRDMDQKEFARLVAMTEKEVEKLGKYEAQQQAFEYVRLIRAYNEAQNKPIFADDKGNSVTAETSQRIVDQYLAEQPWLLDKANGIYEWWDLFMRNWAVGDTISEAEYNRMRQMYPHYVPTYRADKNGVGGAGFVGAGGATVSKAVKKAKGSHSEVMNIEDSFSNIVSKIIRLNRLNELYMNIIDTAMLDEDGTFADMAYFDWDWQDGAYANALITGSADIADLTDTVEETEKAGLEKVGSDYKLTGWLNGRKYTAYISEDLYKSIGMVTGHLANDLEQNLLKAGNTLTTPMKTAITGINPTFAIRNLSRDLPTAIINSISGLNFPKYYAQAAKEIATNSDHWKTFQTLGGTHATYYNDNQGFVKGLAKKNPLKVVGAFNEVTEAQTRFAEYLATIDRLGDTYENRLQGIKNSAEVTVDFSRKGRYGKVINAWVPYWNPAVQGIDKTVRSVIDSPDGSAVWKQASKTLGRAAMTTVLFEAILYGVLKALDRDDEWEELNDRTKDTYYCIPLKDSNRFLKIPKNREWGAILGTPFMRMLEWANGREDPFENYIETAIEPNFLPPAIFRPDSGGGFASDIVGISQALDLAKNEDFAGRTIVPYAYQQGTPGQQYDSETSWVAKKLGQLFNWSPMQIDYILSDYFGDIGEMILQASSEAVRKGDQNGVENVLDIVTSPFLADARYSNASVSKYYDLMDELGRVVQDKKNQMGNDAAKETLEYQTEKAIDEMYGKQISELNRIVRELPDGTEKDNAKSQIAQLTKEAIEFYNDSMSGKVSNPILTATYNGYSESVAKELTRMDSYSEQYSFKPRTTAPTSYVDPKNKKNEYRLDDEQKEYFMNAYAEKYDEIFEQLIQSSKYRKADNEKKAEMLEDAKADVNDAAKEELFDWLEDNRVRSTPKK